MTEPAISLAFFDPAQELHGTLRSGVAVVFDGPRAGTLDEPPELDRDGERFAARSGQELDLVFEPSSEAVDLGGASARVCRVRGRAAGRDLDCLGTIGETQEAPSWRDLDAVRLVSAVFDADDAVLLAARRPRGARGHGDERLTAHLLTPEGLLSVEEARLSTVYDAQGRQRSAGLELWLPGEDFPRRLSGAVRSGLSLALSGLRVDAAVVAWRMDGRDGTGAYEITAREETGAAA